MRLKTFCGEIAARIINPSSKIAGLAWWVFVSLVASVILQINPLLGLVAAAIGGIILGLLQLTK